MKKLQILLAILALPILLSAQDQPQFEFDFARFNYDSTSTYLEIYYMIEPANFTPVADENGNESIQIDLGISAVDKITTENVIQKKYRIASDVNHPDSSSKSLVGLVGFLLEKGAYAINISVSDANNPEFSKAINDEINIEPIEKDKSTVSDIQLAGKIVTGNADKKSIFYKNQMEVVPNPRNIFGKNVPVVFYYAELYHLKDSPSAAKSFVLDRKVFNSYDQIVDTKQKIIPSSNNSIVEAGAVNVSKLPTGAYTLALSLVDTSNNKVVSSTKKFFIYNPDVVEEKIDDGRNLTVLGSEFGVMTEEECDLSFGQIKYIATNNELDQYEKLSDVDSKREFLFNFWKRRDPNPNTPENEFKQEYDKRIKFVNNRFKTFNKPGTKTDRGRVYLQYGEPDEMELHPNDYDKKPYEIWYYNSIEAGVIFVFGDITGYSDYELLHSTKRGELRDESWVRRIIAN